MKKILFLIVVAVIVFIGWQKYSQKKTGIVSPSSPAVFLNNNTETANTANVTLHCVLPGEFNDITGKSYNLENEVYTPAVTLLECRYQDNTMISGVYPTITYKAQLTNDANGVWSRMKSDLQSSPSYKDSSQYPDIFADINPVKEIDQGTFYGKSANAYFEFNYTPVAEGPTLLIDHGMRMLQRALTN